jgi:parallel beta-helix repeat protein
MKRIFQLILLLLSFPLICIAQPEYQKKLQTAMIMAEEGDTIFIDADTIHLTKTLWMDDKRNVVIQGKGMDLSILSFREQLEGAEGIKVTGSSNITITGLSVIESRGDAIKVQETDGIRFIDVRTAWSGKPDKENGAYGLYPVNCTNVLIDRCEASGASDAGIYVGQSKNIIVKNSTAFKNVAGIEIENSLNADVFKNEAYQNTGGLLVFDLPDLVQKKGGFIRVFDNYIHDNNLPNFAPKGNIVAKVPDGTGVMILATNHVEIYNNQIINNNTAGTAIISYYMTELEIKDKDYYPYPTAIYIHDNYYERENVKATHRGRMGKMFHFKLKFGKDVPHIIYDGILDNELMGKNGELPDAHRICIQNNDNQSFANIDAENKFRNISFDLSGYDCSLPVIEYKSQSSD